jgi:hypothetical protein
MSEAEERWHDLREGWEHFGRAAEHFARRVAHDARKFAVHVEKHVGEFAHDLRRDWRGGRPREGSAAEVQRVFEEVRGVLGAVLEGVDDLVTDLFAPAEDEDWTRIVANREATCAACGRSVAAGTDAWVRGRGERRQLRCLDCGVPAGRPGAA